MKNTEFTSYVDDNTPYTIGDTFDDIIETLENESVRLFQCFKKG